MLLKLLVTVLNRREEIETKKKPWEKDNSWLINTNLVPSIIVTQVHYKNTKSEEIISTGISDITIVVTKI